MRPPTNTDDAFVGANNPAAAAFAGNRIDLGVDLFSPIREATMENWGGPGMNASVESDSNYHLIPEFGYNRMVNNNLALGVTVYGNGGMNTRLLRSLMPGTNLFGAPGALGIDLMQLVIAPTLAYKVAPNHSIGISPLIGYQLLQGWTALGGPTSEHDDSFGYGVRVGYWARSLRPLPSVQPTASKMNFEEFDKYNWLFLEQRRFRPS